MARLRLSGNDVIAALRGLSEQERDELLTLLRQADEERALVPEDNRVPIDELIARDWQKSTAAAEDPEKWLATDEAHWECHARHYQRLMDERGGSMGDISVWMGASLEAWAAAEALAAVECPAADVHVVEPAPVKTDEALASLPPATRRDIEYSRARREDARIAQLLAKAGLRDE